MTVGLSLKHIHTKNGFSLVAVLVAVGITGILAMVLAQVMGNAMKANKYIERKVDLNIMKEYLP